MLRYTFLSIVEPIMLGTLVTALLVSNGFLELNPFSWIYPYFKLHFPILYFAVFWVSHD